MAKQVVDIGVEGNDGTGDSIRESFKKVNENFGELYAVFGLGGQISFTNLDDTPETLIGNGGKLVLVKPDDSGLDFYTLVSDAGTNDPNNPDNTIGFEIQGSNLVIKTVNTKLSTDPRPVASNPLKANSAVAYNSTTQNLLLDDAQRNVLVNNFNSTHGTPFISQNNLLISKGFADSKYLNLAGGTLTGALNVPTGATGTQVPQVQEVVKKSGDTMTGRLDLHDHPYPFNGFGTPNREDDLQAATKFYVDNSSFASEVNLYVSEQGNDDQTLTPAGKEGRAPGFAFKTVGAACRKASRMQEASPFDIGPYIQTLTYTDSGTTVNSTVTGASFGYSTIADQLIIVNTITTSKPELISGVLDSINSFYPNFVYDPDIFGADLSSVLDSIKLDTAASTLAIRHNILTRYTGLRYYETSASESNISVNGSLAQTVYAFQRLRTLLLTEINSALGAGDNSSNYWYVTVSNLFDVLLQIIDKDTADPVIVESSKYYNLYVASGPDKYTDQSGDPTVTNPNADIIPGKVIRGKTSGAIGQIVSYKRGVNTVGSPTFDTLELQLLSPIEFVSGEELEFGNLVRENQITIRVETGIYYEQLPIRIPENTSIKGDEFRRTIIRPAEGVSLSPAANTWFYRDATIDGLTTASAGELVTIKNTIGYFGYHYLQDSTRPWEPDVLDPAYNPAKNNDQMDVFLCNDATIIRNVTCQRHGGFMMVLDPEGQILTRSPYAQTCTSFSKSANKKSFHGGMFIDGYTYSMPMTITGKLDNFTLEVEAPATSGLGIRKPKTPCSFFINGVRYQINAIRDYVRNENGFSLATLILDTNSNNKLGYENSVDSPGGAEAIVLQGAGNKSMLANDYTQINDLGYGIVATNNALSELVSVFTYYCHIGYYSRNGSQIRSLTGNNSYGNFGLVSEGSDPDEQARDAVLSQNMNQPVKIYTVDQILTFTGDISLLLTQGETFKQTIDGNLVTGKVAFFEVTTGTITTKVYVENTVNGSFSIDEDIFEGDSTNIGTPIGVSNVNYTGQKGNVSVYIYDTTNYPLNASSLEILHDNGSYQIYDIVSVSPTDVTIPDDLESVLCFSTNTAIRSQVWRCDLNIGIADSSTTGLQQDITFGTTAQFRSKQNLLLTGINSNTLARPSTALVFDESPTNTYRTIRFENTIVGAISTQSDESRVTIDDNFNYIFLTVDNPRSQYVVGDSTYQVTNTVGQSPILGATLGSLQGDRCLAIAEITGGDEDRIIGKIFAWAGKLHRVIGYSVCNDTSGTAGLTLEAFAIVTVADVYNIDPAYSGLGINAPVRSPNNSVHTLFAGLEEGEQGDITINISTCRATSHDFLDIGTGGYNTTNYPDRIYGTPVNEPVDDQGAVDSKGFNSKAQVQERTRGRVFFASTDQDGFFRVGRFFTVDQGTGTISFNAALVLNNIDGLGFKRGVAIREFTPDTTFTNATTDSVPTTTAVEGYINKRLGWDRNGVSIDFGEIIGGGAIRKAGDEMTGSLGMGNNQITNLNSPSTDSDAANKLYVDSQVTSINSLSKLEDIDFAGLAAGNIIGYDSANGVWKNFALSTNATVSDIHFTYDGINFVGNINTGAIVNADISNTAGISQSKLNMQPAYVRADDQFMSQADLGLAVFNSAEFETSGIRLTSTPEDLREGGFVSIKDGGVDGAKLTAGTVANDRLENSFVQVSDGTSSTNIALGETITFNGTANQIDVTENNGTITWALSSEIVAGSSENIKVTDGSTRTGSHYITFVDNTTGDLVAYADSGLSWTPDVQELDLNSGKIKNILEASYNGSTGNNKLIVPSNLSQALIIEDTAANQIAALVTTTGATELSFNGRVTLTGNILPGTNIVNDSGQDIGSLTRRWNTVHATVFKGTATESLYADLAENYLGDADYESGTVLVFGGDEEVTITNKKGDHRVAGIVTTKPAHLMNSHLEGTHVIGVALQGRVPCKVLGKVTKGDMLVTSAIPGYAIVNNAPTVGTVIGKAVGVKTDDGYGIVEVVVGRV